RGDRRAREAVLGLQYRRVVAPAAEAARVATAFLIAHDPRDGALERLSQPLVARDRIALGERVGRDAVAVGRRLAEVTGARVLRAKEDVEGAFDVRGVLGARAVRVRRTEERGRAERGLADPGLTVLLVLARHPAPVAAALLDAREVGEALGDRALGLGRAAEALERVGLPRSEPVAVEVGDGRRSGAPLLGRGAPRSRSEEHTSELQSREN